MTYSESLQSSLKRAGDFDVFDAKGRRYGDDYLIAGCFSPRWIRITRQDSKSSLIPSSQIRDCFLLKKKDPVFKGKVIVKRDESPREDYISIGELVLYAKKVKNLKRKTKQKDKKEE